MYATRASTRPRQTEKEKLKRNAATGFSNRVVVVLDGGDIQSTSLIDNTCNAIMKNDGIIERQDAEIVHTMTQNHHEYHSSDNDDAMIISSSSTTMPSSPETFYSNDQILASSSVEQAMSLVEPSPMLLTVSSASTSDGCISHRPQSTLTATPTDTGLEQDHQHHSRRSSCTGLSALIHAASFQLEYLAEVATSLHNHHTQEVTTKIDENNNSSKVLETNLNVVLSTTPVDNPTIVKATRSKSHKKDSSKSCNDDDFIVQFMNLCCGCDGDHRNTGNDSNSNEQYHNKMNHNMITFLPNGQYVVIRNSTFSQYLQSVDHNLYDNTGTCTFLTDGNLINQNDLSRHKSHEDNEQHLKEQLSQATKQNKPPNQKRRKRIRTIRDFVQLLVHEYGFLLITQQEQHNMTITTITNGDVATEVQHVPDPPNTTSCNGDTSNVKTGPVASGIQTQEMYPEILIFRHAHFLEGRYDQLHDIIPKALRHDNTDIMKNDPVCTSFTGSLLPKRRLSPGFLQRQEREASDQSSSPLDDIQHHQSQHQHIPVKQKVDTTITTATSTTLLDSSTVDANIVANDEKATTFPVLDDIDNTSTIRKSSSGNQSDVTVVTAMTCSTIASSSTNTTMNTSKLEKSSDSLAEDTTINESSYASIQHLQALTRRNSAVSIATEKLQLPQIASSTRYDASRRQDDIQNMTNESDETVRPEVSLVEVGMNICTKEIVISAIECLLVDVEHSYNVYQQNINELSKSSLPNLVPICRHIFNHHHPMSTSANRNSNINESTMSTSHTSNSNNIDECQRQNGSSSPSINNSTTASNAVESISDEKQEIVNV